MWWHESLVHILPSIRPPSFVSPLPTLPRSITTVLRCVRSDLNLIYKRDLHTSASLKRRTGLCLLGDIFVLRVRPGSYLRRLSPRRWVVQCSALLTRIPDSIW